MKRRWALRPDLADCVLEDRILGAVSPGAAPVVVTQVIVPIVLTTSGYYVLTPTTLFTSPFALGATPGPSGINNGISIASAFYLTGTGAMSVMMIGNSSGYPGLAPGATVGGAGVASTTLNSWVIVGSGANEAGAGGVPVVPPNPSGQSLPLNPGSGFLYIVPSVEQPAAPAAPGVNPNEPLRPRVPVAPVAPMGPLVPVPPTPVSPFNSSAGQPAEASGMPASPSSLPALPGVLPTFPNVRPPLSGTIPGLSGTLPTLNPGR